MVVPKTDFDPLGYDACNDSAARHIQWLSAGDVDARSFTYVFKVQYKWAGFIHAIQSAFESAATN
ncbi:hypothetical protein [Exiguobacterium sp. s157]|uniref:hypothetical protein n=1 Tax=Exiguobacterium sp. s157 TaxID=2751233 RepID=UPI001BE68259|nr:hypothetical protein [Exiguobacterium sp. s157]